MSGVPFSLTSDEQQTLGRIARQAIEDRFAAVSRSCTVPDATVLQQELGSFVTLTKGGQLRGCIGSMIGREPLWCNVYRMAQAAAFEDHRFPPLQQIEWEDVALEISVLGPLTPCPGIEHIELGRHGLLLHYSGRSGVFLPKVPVEQGWTLPQYLTHLCYKANLPDRSWEQKGAQLFWFEAFVFGVA